MTSVGNITGSGAMVVKANGVLTLDCTSEVQIKYNNDGAHSLVLNSSAFKPFVAATNNVDLGASNSVWKNVYAKNYTSDTTAYLSSGSGTTSIIFRLGTTEKMRILQPNGYVGINTASPAFQLDVVGSQRLSSSIGGAGGDVSLQLWRGTNASWRILNTAGNLKFQSNYTDKAGDYFDCLQLSYNSGNAWIKGNVGIGVTPEHKLHVNGDARITDKFIVSPFSNYDSSTAIDDGYVGITMKSTSTMATMGLATMGGSILVSIEDRSKKIGAVFQFVAANKTDYNLILGGLANYKATGTLFSIKGSTASEYYNRDTYTGSSWNKGYGAYNVAIANNSAQTPLMVAYRAGKTPSEEGTDRLFAIELVNTGAKLSLAFGGASKYEFSSGGAFYASTGVWTYGYVSAKGQNTSSDARLKHSLNAFEITLEQIAFAPSLAFDWKDGGHDIGSIAQYWEKVNPLLTPQDPRGFLTLQYGKTALLSVITVAKKVKNHEERIAELERENRLLRKRIEQLTLKNK